MPQLSVELDDNMFDQIRENAKVRNMPVSKFISNTLDEYMSNQWPEGFEALFGSVPDETFQRQPQNPVPNWMRKENFREMSLMSDTAYGIYRNGQVFLDVPASVVEESRVKVTFLGKKNERDSWGDIFDVLGPWEDDRDTETIIADIRNARISRSDICL
jgi:hypothetical protein